MFVLQHIFTLELEEYKREGISAADVKFSDNKLILVCGFCMKSSRHTRSYRIDIVCVEFLLTETNWFACSVG